MRNVLFILVIVLTGYIGGMYQQPPLMMLFVAEILFYIIMFLLCLLFRHCIQAEPALRHGAAEKGSLLWWDVKVRNKGILPVSRFCLHVDCGYRQEKDVRRKFLYGSAPVGESRQRFGLRGDHCGLIDLRAGWVRVYDYMSLFAMKKKLSCAGTVAVLPRDIALHVELPSAGWSQMDRRLEQAVDLPGETHNELRQIREYKTGDSFRHIHWNQTARTDRLFVKEFEKDMEPFIELYLDTAGYARLTMEQADAFYQLVWSMVKGFLRHETTVRVCWYDYGAGSLMHADVMDEAGCGDMMVELYAAVLVPRDGRSDRPSMEAALSARRSAYILGLDLGWYRDGQLLHRFSAEGLEHEIETDVFAV